MWSKDLGAFIQDQNNFNKVLTYTLNFKIGIWKSLNIERESRSTALKIAVFF